MDIKLSISLLASNRRESLERCLDSLKPLLVKIPSELIIVLTENNLEIQEIAEKYTPQIIPFTWCNDFSAARNVGLKKAQGEWFLYIDDDEWFDDVEEICEFFLSDEYRNYHSAHYIQRNYQNWHGTKYSDFSAFRMIRLLPESHFQGVIHEELIPRMEPCKYFQTCVHHYGYANDTADKNAEKTLRNIPLLLQAITDRPKQTKNYIQLAKEFNLAGDWKSSEEYCRKGYTVCQENDDPLSAGWLKAFLSYLVSNTPGKASAILEIETMLANDSPSQLICLILYQQLIHLYDKENEPEKALEYGRKFEKMLKKMDEKEGLWEQQSYGEFDEHYVKSPEHLYGTRDVCVSCALKIRDWMSASYFLKLFPWDTEDILSRYYPHFEQWKEKYPAHFCKILSEILSDLTNRLGIHDILNVFEYPGTPIPIYLLFQKALALFEKKKVKEAQKLLSYCVIYTKDSYLKQRLLKEIISHQLSVIPFAAQSGLDSWDELLEKAVSELPYALNEKVRICEEELWEIYPLHSLCLKKKRLEQKLLKGFPLWKDLTDSLENYCQCIEAFYGKLYRNEWLKDENSVFLPADYHFAQITLKGLNELKQGQTTGAVQSLGEAIRICPNMTGVITELFRQASRQLDNPALHAGTEFLQLAKQMKETLRILTDTGQTAQASVVLDQLLPLMPEDLELIRIRQELIRRKTPNTASPFAAQIS